MRKEDFYKLLEKVTNGSANEQEIAAYLKWYSSFDSSEKLWEEMQVERETFRQELISKIYSRIEEQEGNSVSVTRSIKLWSPKVAAAAIIIIGLCIYFLTPLHLKFSASQHYANDIAPGKNKATLTFNNGKVISLSDARTGVIIDKTSLKYNDGTEITSSLNTPGNEVEMLTAATPRGGTYSITLPDGTRVWLNAASSIKFPASFANITERKVELVGEAYFEVAKDKKHAFIVQTARQQVEVLGTHFNINSYADEGQTRTSLLEGSIRIKSAAGNAILKPGEQAVTSVKGIMLVKGDAEDAIAWKNGLFNFKNVPLEEVMRQVARWYDVEVNYPDEESKQQIFNGSVSRYDKVSKILDAITYTGGVKFKIQGRKIIIIK